MVLKFTGPDCCPDEPQIIQNRADVHASGELDDAGDVSAEGQVIAKMARHGGAIVRDQHTVIGFDPDQDVWIGVPLTGVVSSPIKYTRMAGSIRASWARIKGGACSSSKKPITIRPKWLSDCAVAPVRAAV